MKKTVIAISLMALLFFTLFSMDSGIVKGASIGDRLPNPEDGWKRYDDVDPAFNYNGNWKGSSNRASTFYERTHYESKVKGEYIEFEFKGTQLRILTRKGPDRPKNLKVIIDGEEEIFSAHHNNFTNGFDIVYEKRDLDNKRHNVIIENGNGMFLFDAIDIDDDGELFPIGPEDPLPDPDDKEANGDGGLYISNNSIYKLAAGEVFSWGDNSYGQLGLGDMKKRSLSSKEKVNLPEEIIDIVVGKNFVIALGESGKVYGWGDNTSELFGDNGGLILSPIEFDEDIKAIIKAE